MTGDPASAPGSEGSETKDRTDHKQKAPVKFADVQEAETAEIARRRLLRNVPVVAPFTGLALSGGGIRSAAVCLGALQGLHTSKCLERFDYLSTVSGGGYIGCCLIVAETTDGGDKSPFGDDVSDSALVAHLRNYSNYLLPRNRSGLHNWLEAAAVILRGLVANAVCVAAFMIPLVILTIFAFPTREALADPNFVPRLIGGAWLAFTDGLVVPNPRFGQARLPMIYPLVVGLLVSIVLTVWAMLRTWPRFDRATNDTRSAMLRLAFGLLVGFLVLLVLDLQPILIRLALATSAWLGDPKYVATLLPAIAASMTAIAAFAAQLGRFLEASDRSPRARTIVKRGLAKLLLFCGALLLPALLWLTYVWLYQWALEGQPYRIGLAASLLPDTRFDFLVVGWLLTSAVMLLLRANNYSLHWFYRDRLAKAFLVATDGEEVTPRDSLKLSELRDRAGLYPIINAALNVQGSLKANKRGRNADFFSFAPAYSGSELTGYVRTQDLEGLDQRLDLATAMAVSGAAASANMGSNTVRLLSPTLSLLNVRLGYYLLNPRFFGEADTPATRFRAAIQRSWDRFYLLVEMFNGLTENRRTIYLTDGGHVENLGIYELLRRQCKLIVAIDAEADPELACGSLLRLERYARIDLGVRINLPWEEISRQSRKTSAGIQAGGAQCEFGPHCAIGKINYGLNDHGIIAYFKSSLSGDEKDYVLDYARRHPAFPHESTSDQFFSEEQFEMYRALGFHLIEGLMGRDKISFVQSENGFVDEEEARAAVLDILGKVTTK